MDRLRRRRGDEDEWRERAPQRDAPQGADAESLLDLQARAGNRAVTELVGAQGTDAGLPQVQREGPDATPTATPDDDRGGKPRVDTMSIPDLKLAVPIQSIDGSVSGRRSPGRNKEDTSGEVTVTFAAEHLGAKLWDAINKGREFGTVTIKFSTLTITLQGVIISGVQVSRETASMTLNYSSIKLDPGPKEKDSSPAYDVGPNPSP